MRKMLLLAVLASFFCGAGIAWASEAVPSEAILGFGLLRTYSTDQPVILRVDEEPYYDNVTKLVGIDFDFAAQIKKGYTGALPYGTLTDMDTKTRYMLTPNEPSGNISMYDVQGIDSLSNFAKSKVMWNVYTSPDVIVGATTIPEDISAYTVSVNEGTIVPYVKINHNSDIEGLLGRVDVYFVQSGDKTYTPVALGDTTVNVCTSTTAANQPLHQTSNLRTSTRPCATASTSIV